ncbi:hypothetical protein HYFRA_00003002 [Hymenoscyphus fraxineus]|uniref:SEC7 domain-containing protein n=1 Tax=Hymenoscyphus fraxineus TaxID=746836 RepID=A0A9N9KSI6_9HELO|nr:hypothetical protein HYFRA_00003002 [Hymenoscyphus fraxineus]
MQSYENSQMVSSRSAGVPLNANKRKIGKRRDSSPAQTPATPPESRFSKANLLQSSRASNNKQRETFLDDITPVNPTANKDNGAGRERDTHDLSLSPRQVTRDSLVNNMLLSLDQFSFGSGSQEGDVFGRQPTTHPDNIYSNYNDEESYQPVSNFAPRAQRPGGHNYSYSSDYDIADDSSRYSGPSRGRRSNSGSPYQPGAGRINNTRMEGASNVVASSRPPPIPPRGIHSRSGMGSKGSSANSFDLGYAQVLGSQQRWAHGLGGRSSSFDYGRDHPKFHAKADSYDAAPMPTVPGGPRRTRPTSPVNTSHELAKDEAGLPRLERKRSAKSSKSAYRGRNASKGGRIDYGLSDSNRELPPLPAFIREQAASPLGEYGKSKGAPNAGPSTPQPPKERPGFFRRVFGSSRSNSTSTPEAPPSHGSGTSTETMNRPSSRNHIANQLRAQSIPSHREAPPPVPKDQPQVLNKKPSSFFRRRKKSFTEAEPPALAPQPVFDASEYDGKPVPSPVSSLRKVMNPYLRSQSVPHNMDQNTYDESQQHARGFSPDYEPDKTATIRTVRSSLRHNPDTTSPSGAAQRPFLSSASANTNGPHGTFLQDASDDAHINASKSALISREGPETTSPPNHVHAVTSQTVKRDMALVAEYESRHSKNPSAARFTMNKPSPILESPRSRAEFKPFLPPDTAAPLAKDEDWVVLSPTKSTRASGKDDRVWLEPSSDEEEVAEPASTMNQTASRVSSESNETIYKSATSSLIVTNYGGGDERQSSPLPLATSEASAAPKTLEEAHETHPESSEVAVLPGPSTDPIPDETIPTENDREKAQKIYDGNEDFIQKERAAAWMGEEGIVRARTLVAYLDLYDFANLNILAALRNMCSRLVLKGESQQVDRILDVFATRWCKCNPNHGFKVTDVVHTICYSILLLNTDLHLADIDQKMTRSQFVKNTMPTIRRSVAESAPDAFETRPSILPGKSQTFDSVKGEPTIKIDRASGEYVERPSWRMSFKPPTRTDSDGSGIVPTPLDYDTPQDDCGPLVKAPFHGTLRTWEVQVEIVLKDFYNSIRTERLPLFGAPIEKPVLQPPSSHSLSVFGTNVLRRTPSVLSKAPSETHSYARGRTADTVRGGTGKWNNKNRSRPRLHPGSSRTSLDDQSSMWSPSASSSTWSKYSLGKTQTSMSVDSLSSNWQADYQQSIGFANALSQAIIREEHIGSAGSNGTEREQEELRAAPLLEDESLELAGAPWAKEGILKHKHHLESLGKKAKDRNWNEIFAVVEKGYLSLFSFSTKSMRKNSKNKAVGGVVGGGNWQENAQNLGSFLLRQTIASALPSPGYSKARPHVWALSLPTGAVHLFQVGTPDIVKEFVSTANYWSARLSNHPLVGGISNIEYGWSDGIVNNSLVEAIKDSTTPVTTRPSTSHSRRPSMQGSLRSIASVDQGQFGGIRARLPGDKVTISDWTPPTQSMRSSNLMEADQLKTLVDYVAGIEAELQLHNQLRSPMLLAFTPRHPNSQKAMANWEKKSSYLLREIVKFRTYIDVLQLAESNKQRIYAERAADKALSEDYDEEDMPVEPLNLTP